MKGATLKKLAILILTKNEKDNIADVVQNALQCTNEVLVIDSGSTDGTVALAGAQGAKTCFRPWDHDFSAQRNFALTQTEADWVLYLDADERLDPNLIKAIKAVVHNDNLTKQYTLQRKSVAFGTTFEHGVLSPDDVARIFPRTKVQWVNKIHEHPECALPIEKMPGHIEHYTYKSWHHWEGKLCQYTTIWAEDAFKQGKYTSLAGIFFHSIGGFLKMFVVRVGFMDGWMGTYLCFNHFFYTMLKYLKLYELQRKSDI